MPVFFAYLLKCSVALTATWLFYVLVLRRLTFYNWNRVYLLLAPVAASLIPLVNIGAWWGASAKQPAVALLVPPIDEYLLTGTTATGSTAPVSWWWVYLVIAAGILFFLARLLLQYISYRRVIKSASVIYRQQVTVYQVNENIAPFSFGSSIFINQHNHSEPELKEIIRHEYVHVKQKHTFDYVLAEILCVLNWYNPFAWLTRYSIRQNLEFIADEQVLQNGVARKSYQYLLLKVIGDNQYSFTGNFNISSLRQRIVMMNRLKSNRRSIIRFALLFPLLLVLLLSFRPQHKPQATSTANTAQQATVITDTVPLPPQAPPPPPMPFNMGDNVQSIVLENGTATVTLTDKTREVYHFNIPEEQKNFYERYAVKPGNVPVAQPAPPTDAAGRNATAAPEKTATPKAISNGSYEYFEGHINGVPVKCRNQQVTVSLPQGKEEKYNLADPAQRRQFALKYGGIPAPPPPPPPPPAPL